MVEERRGFTSRQPLAVELRMSGIFDSNIDHDEADTDSYGTMLAARVRLRTPVVNLQYQAGFDRFSNTSRWDRVTHRARVETRQRLGSNWRASAVGELSIGQTSDDRETLGNQYTLTPVIEHRFDDTRRISVYGAYRFRTFGELVSRNDRTLYWGSEFRHDDARYSWTAGYRYERVRTLLPSNRYARHALAIDYGIRPSRRDELLFGAMLRPRAYPHRMLELSSGDALRRDRRWTAEARWLRTVNEGLTTEAIYTFDRQASNDPEKLFRAHRFALAVGWVVW